MEKILVEQTPKSPLVNFDPDNGIIELKGRSIPENSVEFYGPLLRALTIYSENPKPNTTASLFLPYFSTSSSKCILEVLRLMEVIHTKGAKVKINWMYESDDIDMMEAGEDYQVMINVPFTMVPVEPV